MHTKEELDLAIIKLYNDYKTAMDKYNKGDLSIIKDLVSMNEDEKKYTKEEVYYIAFNAMLLLKTDMMFNGKN